MKNLCFGVLTWLLNLSDSSNHLDLLGRPLTEFRDGSDETERGGGARFPLDPIKCLGITRQARRSA